MRIVFNSFKVVLAKKIWFETGTLQNSEQERRDTNRVLSAEKKLGTRHPPSPGKRFRTAKCIERLANDTPVVI